MPGLAPEADPAEAGFDNERLARIDRHFARYVDDGRIPTAPPGNATTTEGVLSDD